MPRNNVLPEKLFPRIRGLTDPRDEREIFLAINRIYDYFNIKTELDADRVRELLSTQAAQTRTETSQLLGEFATRLIGDQSSTSNPLTTIGSGTVTSVNASGNILFSVTGGPITESGSFSFLLNNQSANRIFAGPTTGAAASPTFRALVKEDINIPFQLTTSTNADPTVTEYPTGTWGVHKNTTSGNVFLAYNDGGVIVKVQLV